MAKASPAAVEVQEPVSTVVPNVPRRILVTSGSDTAVGKSTLIRHCFIPLLKERAEYADGIKFFAVEDAGRIPAGEDKKYLPAEVPLLIGDMRKAIRDKNACAIVEVGGQHFADLMSHASTKAAGRFQFDKVIVPVGAGLRAEITLKYLDHLINKQGIPASLIYLIFNSVERMDAEPAAWAQTLAQKEYQDLLQGAKNLGVAVHLSPITKSTIFNDLRLTVGDEYSVIAQARLEPCHYEKMAEEAEDLGDLETAKALFDQDVIQMQCGVYVSEFTEAVKFIFP